MDSHFIFWEQFYEWIDTYRITLNIGTLTPYLTCPKIQQVHLTTCWSV